MSKGTQPIADTWISRSLIDLADYHNGAAFKPKDWVEDGLPIIRIEQINNPSAETDKYNGTVLPNNLLQNGDLIFSWSATLKVVIWRGGKAVLNQHLYKVVPKAGVEKQFLAQLIDFNMDRLSGQSQGSTMKHVTRRELTKFSVAVPISPARQKKIAIILQTVDEAIEKTEALIEKYSQIKAGMMQDLFTRGLTAEGKLRPARSEAPELYQETPIGWIPKEWRVKSLGEACNWNSGGTPSRANTSWWEGSMPWLSPKDMKVFELDDTTEHVTKQAALAGSRIMPPNTVFIVIRGMILAHSFPVVLSKKEFCFNQDIKAVSGNEDLKNRFLAYWFEAQKGLILRKTTEATHGTKRFDMKDLHDLPIGVPNPEEQGEILRRLDVLDSKIEKERTLLSKTRLQKSGLMHDLLTGERPVELDDPEPANV
ncbi:restriction endonuclease subunit S [Roseibium aggregatum]|uniref:restriction endonuclease subunit S n=1 Tax=Roseibium aggregatum TaxID=187304 RepID=UPI00094B77A7|nr:restriction endonuclease subunit S [Roseibium aggregatum]UFI02143.1 restriction endonuclease subunit S [Roseibium aggregatum]